MLLPDNLEQYPYIIWTSHGIHTHLPPPPTRAPPELVEELQSVIRRATDASTTRGKSTSRLPRDCTSQLTRQLATLLRSGFFNAFLAEKNAQSVGDLHVSFHKKDRIRSMISLAKLTLFPEGPHFAGVQFEYNEQLRNPDTVCTY